MRRRLTLLLAALALAAPASSHAREVAAFYEASWASLPAATLVLGLDDDATHYRDTLHLETVGLPRLLIHLRVQAEADGAFTSGAARPDAFNVTYDLRRYRGQRVRMHFVERDGVRVAERQVDDSSNKPPLPERYRRDIVDPMTAFAIVRERLRGRPIKIGDQFTVPIFDDVRRFDLRVTVVSSDQFTKLVELRMDMVPIAGFHDKHGDGHDPEDAPRPIEITFRNDADLLPTRLEVAVGFMPLVIRFHHRCADATHCEAPADKTN